VVSRRALLSAKMRAGVSSSRKSSMSVLEVQELLPSALNFCTIKQAINMAASTTLTLQGPFKVVT